MIRFQCPTCRKVLKAPDRGAGQKIDCPRCRQRLLIPPPARPTSQTMLGRSLPNTAASPPVAPGRKPPDWLADVERAEKNALSPPAPPFAPAQPPSREVLLECPTCRSPLAIREELLGRQVVCPRCGSGFSTMGPPPPGLFAAPPQPPSSSFDFARPNETPGPHDDGPQPARAAARTALAGLGAVLLIVGLFCPMLTLPKDVSVSFFDYSVKTAWLVTKALAVALDWVEPEDAPAFPSEGGFDLPKGKRKLSGGLRAAALGAGLVLTVLTPFCPPLLILLGFLSLWAATRGPVRAGRRSVSLLLAGVLCLMAIFVMFAGPLLLLWAVPDVLPTLALAVASFGFGWGVLLAGSALVLTAGLVH